MRAGAGVYIHCAMRPGTGTAAACLLALAGADGDPVALTRCYLPAHTVETAGQRTFVATFAGRRSGPIGFVVAALDRAPNA